MTTALYRRYRPETFQDVIGQEHVTEPLMTALRKNRVSHAYLFSGPRGCGKTTSARILARCLNCAQGPTPTPCGECESCRDLARDGAGSLDVIEMDAASHGGVDHARDLRERATFAPVRDRFKIFIIDEAHMVTREGFNALLKIVEEPPEHVKFIFATTEPAKVLTTIRSRTHHYPFRLVPPEPLMQYLEGLCRQENVPVEPGVLSLVVRAGGGSVRDSLSVLDQLMAGSTDEGITYDLAVALLGYTHAALLDDVLDAFAAGDAATVFSSVDRVIQTGQDPRRFVEDLLERFRDLIVVDAVPDAAANILHGMPADQINRLRNQAGQLGAAELSRSADITNTALNEMTGATSPQLHLELLCARILLPSAEDTTRGVTARVDRLERRMNIPRGTGVRQPMPHESATADTGSTDPGPSVESAVPGDSAPPQPDGSAQEPGSGQPVVPQGWRPSHGRPGAPAPTAPESSASQVQDVQEPTEAEDPGEQPEGTSHPAAHEPVARDSSSQDTPPADGRTGTGEPEAAAGDRPAQETRDRHDAGAARPGGTPGTASRHEHTSRSGPRGHGQDTRREGARPDTGPAPQDSSTAQDDLTSGELEMLRSSWPEIVSALAEIRRVAWSVTMRGTPISFDGQTLRIAFEAEGDLLNFPRFENDVRQAIHQVLGIDCRVDAVRPGDTHGSGHAGDHGGPRPPGGRGGSGGTGGSGDPDRTGGPGASGGSGGRQDGRGGPGAPDGSGNRWSRGRQEGSGGPRGRGEPGGTSGHGESGDTSGRTPAGHRTGSPRRSSPPEPDEAPEYFRDPGGFGTHRHARDPQGDGHAPSPARTARQGDSSSPQQTRPRQDGTPPRDPASEDSAQDRDQTPVTSWAVAAIPQGDTAADSPSAGPTAATPETTASDEGAAEAPGQETASGDAATPEPSATTSSATEPPTPEEPGPQSSRTDASPAENNSPGHSPAEHDTAGTVAQDSTSQDAAAPGSSHPATPEGQNDPRGSGDIPRTPPSSATAPSGAGVTSWEDAGPEYWHPDDVPPPPEDEPPADMHEAVPAEAGARPRGRHPDRGFGTSPAPGGPGGPGATEGPQATGRKPSWRERHADVLAASRQQAQQQRRPQPEPTPEDEDFSPSADDESIEDSTVYGRAAIERILGGMLVDEHPHTPGP